MAYDHGVPELRVFISHASPDADLARSTVRLIEQALKVSARQIRCTSVDGYRLPGGTVTDDTLRNEILSCESFIALITPASLASMYVLFELGARWGARKDLLPLVARGTSPGTLRAPLASLNILDLTSRPQILQAIDQLATTLRRPLEPAASYDEAVYGLAAAASRSSSSPATLALHPKTESSGTSGRAFPIVVSPVAATDFGLPPLRQQYGNRATSGPSPKAGTALDEETKHAAIAKMKRRMGLGYPGTPISTLAEVAGITEHQARELLIREPDVEFGHSLGLGESAHLTR